MICRITHYKKQNKKLPCWCQGSKVKMGRLVRDHWKRRILQLTSGESQSVHHLSGHKSSDWEATCSVFSAIYGAFKPLLKNHSVPLNPELLKYEFISSVLVHLKQSRAACNTMKKWVSCVVFCYNINWTVMSHCEYAIMTFSHLRPLLFPIRLCFFVSVITEIGIYYECVENSLTDWLIWLFSFCPKRLTVWCTLYVVKCQRRLISAQ